ncbi:hypothetical protein A3A55_01010 [Candidatus Roizmanbacteria bacterium RIFCSPLOWO2_01_FULL_40_14]|uniref:UAA transporter family n=1 Tax=Candidatus Roizmanbacteria bacterium GW2011_GWA1_41_13 TaxID=1618474 RepID=A0A0G0UZ33_9BACT|nr:MAG: UAA transporter family [Candidatus Levybacteria bacterium GW2011_GWA2_40_16]KKR94004.1 MAG: UAA transporter family [Candidatus Roizmanbacteria bacterium GW2011_GWA1_41_13]OGK48470.1 MAG: hypothetical protein A3A55_01010 [Candidatus Roizmanbacteria bacterium RIFCSPLOWO2_01_FULL_40_14]
MKKIIGIIALTALCGSSVPVFAKIALEIFQPFTLVFIRFLLATISLLPFVKQTNELSFENFKKLFSIAFIGALNPILLFIALQTTQASVTPLIYASVPIMSAFYLQSVKKQKITKDQYAGILIGFTGVCIIILLPLITSHQYTPLEMMSGNVLILFASFAFMLYGFYSKSRQVNHAVSPIALTFYFSLVTLLLSAPFALYEVIKEPILYSDIRWTHVVSALEIGIVGTSIFYFLYQYSLKISSAITASLFTYLQPVLTILLAIALLGEKITIPLIIGAALAVYGAGHASRKNNH